MEYEFVTTRVNFSEHFKLVLSFWVLYGQDWHQAVERFVNNCSLLPQVARTRVRWNECDDFAPLNAK